MDKMKRLLQNIHFLNDPALADINWRAVGVFLRERGDMPHAFSSPEEKEIIEKLYQRYRPRNEFDEAVSALRAAEQNGLE